MHTLALLFGLRARVPRKAYLVWGFALAALKIALDTAIVYGGTHKLWSPLGYILPSVVLRQEAVGAGPTAMHALLVVTALPFLWIGLTMSVRRAADAGVSPWLGMGFVVPVLSYFTILALAILPTKAESAWAPAPLRPYRTAAPGGSEAPPPSVEVLPSGMRAALLGLLASMAIGLSMLWLTVYGLGAYGTALFFATPFAMGAASAAVYNQRGVRPLGKTIGVALLGVGLTGCCCLLFAVEGVICLLMALPIAAVVSVVGAVVGWAIASQRSAQPGPRGAGALLFVLPLFATAEAKVQAPILRDVRTAIEIDAPPERVWPNVIGFSDLPPPPNGFARLGIAYPRRARIDGVGVGAVRRCEFSTGPFVEPITTWDPPRRLAFDVTAQPPSMTEWSPYQSVKAPHLEGYMVSRGGEFRLTALPGGRTRLEGTTHYTLAIYPEQYWVLFAEPLLHAIHGQVLSHIKGLSER